MRYSILLLALMVCGCTVEQMSTPTTVTALPSDATELVSVGNGWYSFKWKGQCFLTQQHGQPGFNTFDRVLTRIECKESADES